MTATPQPAAPDPRPRLTRAVEGRWVAGVCRGLADYLGVDVRLIRVLTVILTVSTGAGLVGYLFLWAFAPQDRPDFTIDPAHGIRPTHEPEDSEPQVLLAVGALLLAAGVIVFARTQGWRGPSGIVLPLLVVAVGAIVAWSQLDAAQRDQWLGGSKRGHRFVWARVALGLVVAAVGLLALASRGEGVRATLDSLLATVTVLLGVLLVAAPIAVQLWSDLRREQVLRARETERADIAAHLHDGVLQTLALIQRGADDPARVRTLARAQERELRSWLYGDTATGAGTMSAALKSAVAEVEDLHAVPVDLVVTGDRDLDEAGMALVRAFREALLNAVRHGSPPVTAYVEAGPSGVAAYIRDHGPGFDPASVPEDRLGVKESIIGRMERAGGTAIIRSRDPGTEVQLALPPPNGDPS